MVTGRDSIYVSKWFGFNDFSFMQDKCTPNDTIDTMQVNLNSPSNETPDTSLVGTYLYINQTMLIILVSILPRYCSISDEMFSKM